MAASRLLSTSCETSASAELELLVMGVASSTMAGTAVSPPFPTSLLQPPPPRTFCSHHHQFPQLLPSSLCCLDGWLLKLSTGSRPIFPLDHQQWSITSGSVIFISDRAMVAPQPLTRPHGTRHRGQKHLTSFCSPLFSPHNNPMR